MSFNPNLIFDLGMSEGNDTAFYLLKGFKVVGVDADRAMVRQIEQRFANDIASENLFVENCAAAESFGIPIVFHADLNAQGHSSISNIHGKDASELVSYEVETINFPALTSKYGVPYFLKIDIEGAEPPFLKSMLNSPVLPQYISSEVMNLDPIYIMRDLGYTHFRIMNQLKNQYYPVPDPPREGSLVPYPDRAHWSGFFGRELPGNKWFDFDEIVRIFTMLHELHNYETLTLGWLDCHAYNPKFGS